MANSFFGGVHPEEGKVSRDEPVVVLPAPAQVVIPLSQHIGAPCNALVAKGDRVLMGQKIGDNTGLCVPVHSSVSGTVVAIEPRPHTGGGKVMSVVIENDGEDSPDPSIAPREDISGLSPEELMEIIHQAGCVGMGGATFPTHVKISSGIDKVDVIIVNGAECEPYITADDRLLRENTDQVIGGVRVLLKLFGLPSAYIAVEENKPEAIEALREAAAGSSDIIVQPLKTRYPQGAEKQLIQTITGREVPPGGLPAAVGCAVFNAASVAAVYRAVYEGMPLIDRIVTVSGPAIAAPRNFRVRIGTSFEALIEAAGGFKAEPYKILAGGPMMGVTQFDLSVPVIKGSNAITCFTQKQNTEVENPVCIRCGKCIGVCPMNLMPVYLYMYERKSDLAALEELHVTDCIECGACTYNCPGRLHLTHSCRTGKQKLTNAKAANK